MSETSPSSRKIFAPAKINLFLHMIGRRKNGYHELESLVSFADIGDYIILKQSKIPKFDVSGPFAASFNHKELDSSPQSQNIVMKALWGLSRLYNRAPEFHVHLEKNLPLSAGIGGGSADAGALIWGVVQEWGAPPDEDAFHRLMLDIGADTPVCYTCENTYVTGIGENLAKAQNVPEMHAILINPLKPCPTATVFKSFHGQFRKKITYPADVSEDYFIGFLRQQHNDLQAPACTIVEDITNILNAIQYSDGCKMARMSGSGATCFGIFENAQACKAAAKLIQDDNPDWWVKSGIIGSSARY